MLNTDRKGVWEVESPSMKQSERLRVHMHVDTYGCTLVMYALIGVYVQTCTDLRVQDPIGICPIM